MNIESISESAWTSVIDGTRNLQFGFLALELLLVNLRNRLQAKQMSLLDCIGELKTFYAKFSRLPLAAKDFNKIAERGNPLTNRLVAPEEAARIIASGQSVMLAGEEALLAGMPPGNWIGGTTPYFMGQDGGCLCKDKLFVTEIPGEFQTSIHTYATSELPRLYQDAGEGEVSFVILPADSSAHQEFALHAPSYPGFAFHPLVGWIAGMDLATLGQTTAKVFRGAPEALDQSAVVMRMKLPADRLAQINILNLFQPGEGDSIRFPNTGFSATTALVNGQEQNLAQYLQRIQADTRLPLVANYRGAMVNVSLRSINLRDGRVEFYAPVVTDIEYKLASPVVDYVSAFEARLKELSPENVLFSCNCLHNYLYSKLEGRRTGALVGPVTFGEIAFQLLNQTLVYVEIVNVASAEPLPSAVPSDATPLELSAAHEELQASERRFRTLSESAPMGIFLTDTEGRVLYENRHCQKLAGLSTATPMPGDWVGNIHPNDLPWVTAALRDADPDGRELEFEFRFVTQEGDPCWVHSRTAVLRSETGVNTGRIGVLQDVTERKRAEIELERLNRDLNRASREAGIAEVASGVLHNVKNAINSLNISAGVIADQLQRSKAPSLAKVAALLREHSGDLGSFITDHPKGKLLPDYLGQLAEVLAAEGTAVLKELREFQEHVQHVKDIVMMQQSYAKLGGTSEKARPVELMDDSLRIVSAGLARHGIQVVRDYAPNLPDVLVEKHKVLQILVNFIRNAKHACQEAGRPDRKLVLRVTNGGEHVHFAVTDNGVGIPPENFKRLFEHGFTTKKEGHGFGLHSCALAVRELGGDIQTRSDGIGTGATFTLRLPLCPPALADRLPPAAPASLAAVD